MARYRLSEPARADIVAILHRSELIRGKQARIRYRALLTAALRYVAADPNGPLSSDQTELLPGARSLHIRHCRSQSREVRVASPVHVIYYRALQPSLVEIMRVLHERMDPRRHIGRPAEELRD